MQTPPLGPWKNGGVLVDSRAPVLNQDGSALQTTNGGHNTHGSIEQINGQWYAFYHRPPRGFGYARQAVVQFEYNGVIKTYYVHFSKHGE